MAPQPVVTGLSPKEGPPGTRVTIRGEFLGSKATDLIGEFLDVFCPRKHLSNSEVLVIITFH